MNAQKFIQEIEKEIRVASSYGESSTLAIVHDKEVREEVQSYFLDQDYMILDSKTGDEELFYIQWRY